MQRLLRKRMIGRVASPRHDIHWQSSCELCQQEIHFPANGTENLMHAELHGLRMPGHGCSSGMHSATFHMPALIDIYSVASSPIIK